MVHTTTCSERGGHTCQGGGGGGPAHHRTGTARVKSAHDKQTRFPSETSAARHLTPHHLPSFLKLWLAGLKPVNGKGGGKQYQYMHIRFYCLLLPPPPAPPIYWFQTKRIHRHILRNRTFPPETLSALAADKYCSFLAGITGFTMQRPSTTLTPTRVCSASTAALTLFTPEIWSKSSSTNSSILSSASQM